MAKSVEQENTRARGLMLTNFGEQPSVDEDAEFLRTLDQKQASALQLSEKLAVWFGDHTHPPIRL